MTKIDNNTGICIQIGLLSTIEMAYLTESDWKKKGEEQPQLNQIPVFDYDQWSLYAVDCDPVSISVIQQQYNKPNLFLVCAYVSTPDIIIKDNKTNILVPSISLSELINRLELPRVDILKMDIEGSELEVLTNYDFIVKPHYISVESHEVFNKGCTKLLKTSLENQGYEIINTAYTNMAKTIEIQAQLPYAWRS